MKTLYTLLFAATIFSGSLFALTAGDIAILGMNADDPERVGFVALANIPANTSITFTDCGWSNAVPVFRVGEHGWVWSHNADVPAGTVVIMQFVSPDWTIESGPGSINTTDCAGFGANTGLNASGDTILAYQGAGWSDRPTSHSDAKWLYGFDSEVWAAEAADSSVSSLPSALNNAETHLSETTTEWDSGYFASGTVAQASVTVTDTKQHILDLIRDGADLYYKDNNPIATWPTYSFTVVPEPGMMVAGGLALLALLRRK